MIIFISTMNVLVLTRFIPDKELIITQFGVYSLTVYLLHPYAIKSSKVLAEPYLKYHQKLLVAFVYLGSFAIVYVLSREVVSRALNGFLNLIYKILCIE